jgi:large subunit ribosomal protein L19
MAKNKKNISIVDIKPEVRGKLGISAGDTVRVFQKVKEKDGKIRLQVFEGLVLARKHGNEMGGTFTVRRVASGVGVERIFPLHSPAIEKIEIVRRAKVRRAKLYYIREKVAREIKRQMRNAVVVREIAESPVVEAKEESAPEETPVSQTSQKE